ncbi:hypothetical protein, variant [Verruconis gallopava]|uniref:Glutamate decarboxylase n=1 Tax=Verruconis gallopava TaxID=253628 RepID=A0A0D2A2E4_9PEZI|nr:hypothetical protein, variant [Verruconis gallopava]KIW00928.1 hypothetical protein, variant [Verruconis gallopava]
MSRAKEVSDLLLDVKNLVDPFLDAADRDIVIDHVENVSEQDNHQTRTALLECLPREKLEQLLDLKLPEQGNGKDGLLMTIEKILKYSVNTWDQGFMDKLFSSTNAVGVASEYLLAILNTNVHVYQCSPVLTLVEKYTARALAELVGFENAPYMGGICQNGGSASNSLSILVARNTMFPQTKTDGYGEKKFVLFTSKHGHYSVEKAAQMFGFGSHAVRSVPVDIEGRMIPTELSKMIKKSRESGETPFYVNATAGTTVLGSFDPFDELAAICKSENLWLHVDGSYGGSILFSENLRKDRMRGLCKADTFAITPHKMLGVPITCSFLIGRDMRQFYAANTIDAEYLFHQSNHESATYDLGHFTPQCGRKGDALKMFLGWLFYGRQGYGQKLECAYEMANHLYRVLSTRENVVMVSKYPLPCMQVCFYWARDGRLSEKKEVNSRITERIANRLISMGFMIDYAPGEQGKFFRVVINREVRRETIEALVRAIEKAAQQVTADGSDKPYTETGEQLRV